METKPAASSELGSCITRSTLPYGRCGCDARSFESTWNAKIRSKLTERASFCATLELYSLHTVI